MAFVGDVLGEVVSGVGTERVRESAKAMSFAIEALEFEHAVSDEERREREGL